MKYDLRCNDYGFELVGYRLCGMSVVRVRVLVGKLTKIVFLVNRKSLERDTIGCDSHVYENQKQSF